MREIIEFLPDPWTLVGLILGWLGLREARKSPPGRHRKTKKYRRGKREK